MDKAIVTKKDSKAYGKEVYIQHRRGRVYYCSFTENGKSYPFWKGDLNIIREWKEGVVIL